MEGVLMTSPSKIALLILPLFLRRKILGMGQGGSYDSRRATALGLKISMPCAASPPKHFCHEKVKTSILLQSISMAKAALVASQSDRPSRLAGIQFQSGTFTPLVVPLATKTTSLVQSTDFKSGSFP